MFANYLFFQWDGCQCTFAARFLILGSADEKAQRISCSTSRRLRYLVFTFKSVEKADSHSHVELNGNNIFRAVLLISGYNDAILSQKSVTGKASNTSWLLESFFMPMNLSCSSFSTFSEESRNESFSSDRSSLLSSIWIHIPVFRDVEQHWSLAHRSNGRYQPNW